MAKETDCLLITTPEGRRFLTRKSHYDNLVEFAQTFDAELYLARPVGSFKLHGLKSLGQALCDPNFPGDAEVRCLRKLYPASSRRRQATRSTAQKIRESLRQRFLTGTVVSLKELKKEFSHLDLSDACLCQHLSVTRKSLEAEGHHLEKLGAGTYKVEH